MVELTVGAFCVVSLRNPLIVLVLRLSRIDEKTECDKVCQRRIVECVTCFLIGRIQYLSRSRHSLISCGVSKLQLPVTFQR